MKTLIVYELVPEKTFFLVDGDRSELHGCFINTESAEKFSEAIREEVSDAKWIPEVQLPFDTSALQETLKVVHCGFIL
jgi:hypothetical protein